MTERMRVPHRRRARCRAAHRRDRATRSVDGRSRNASPSSTSALLFSRSAARRTPGTTRERARAGDRGAVAGKEQRERRAAGRQSARRESSGPMRRRRCPAPALRRDVSGVFRAAVDSAARPKSSVQTHRRRRRGPASRRPPLTKIDKMVAAAAISASRVGVPKWHAAREAPSTACPSARAAAASSPRR